MTGDPIVAQVIAKLHELVAGLRAKNAPQDQIDALTEQAMTALDTHLRRQAEKDPERKRTLSDDIGAVAQTVLDASTFGLEGLAEDALSPGNFQQNRELRAANKAALPAKVAIPAAIAGTMLNPVGAFLGPAKAGAGVLRTLGKGIVEGGLQGGAMAAGENIGREGGADALASRVGTGVTLGGAFGGAGGVLGRRFARGMARETGISEPVEAATRRAQSALDADKVYQVPVFPTGVGAPKTTTFDVAGPTFRREVAEASKSVPGRQVTETALAGRKAEMPRKLGEAFDAATGTTQKDADELAKEIATLESERAAANESQKAAYDKLIADLKASHKVVVEEAKRTALPKAIQIVNEEAGGEVPNAIKTLQATKEARAVQGKADYTNAIEMTKGQPTPLTDAQKAFLASPTGQAAWKAAQRDRADIVATDPTRKLPEVVKETGKPQGFVPTQLGPNAALSKPETEVVPDAEAWEYMKRYLAKAAKLEPGQVTPEGIDATNAATVRPLFDVAFEARGEPFKQAAENYAIPSAQMEATKLGITPSKGLPAADNALTESLGAVESKVAKMDQTQEARFREGRQFLIASMLRQGKSPAQIARLLGEPTSDMSQYVAQAFGPDAPARLGAKFRGLEPPDLTLPPKPAEIPTDLNVAAAQKGLGITSTPSSPSPSNPTLSLPALEQEASTMAAQPRQYLQRGAAADFRGDLSAGKSLDLGTPERARQFAFAAKSPDDASRMAKIEQAWNDLLKQHESVLPSQPQAAPQPENVGDVAASSISPWFKSAVAKMARMSLTHPWTKAAAEAPGLEDQAFNRLGFNDPAVIEAAIRSIADMDANTGRVAQKWSSSAGRIAGMLAP